MKVLRRYSFVQVLGTIWLPPVQAAERIDLSSYDIGNMTNDDGSITRDDVEQWLCSHSGNFQHVKDFSASIELGDDTIDIPWNDEENEFAYYDCMHGFTDTD